MEKELARFLRRYIGLYKIDVRSKESEWIICNALSVFMNRRYWLIKD